MGASLQQSMSAPSGLAGLLRPLRCLRQPVPEPARGTPLPYFSPRAASSRIQPILSSTRSLSLSLAARAVFRTRLPKPLTRLLCAASQSRMRGLVALVFVAALAACRAAEVVPAAAALEGALVRLMGTVLMPQGQPE